MADPTFTITNLETERKFTDYFARRATLRDTIRYGVYPNLTKFLAEYAAFQADYGPEGGQYDEQIWAYYQEQIMPIAESEAAMLAAAQGIVSGLEEIEKAAPGTFGI